MDDKIFPSKKWERLVNSEREERMSVKKFFDISNPSPDEVWGDIGCGPGYFTLPLAQKVKKIFAADISEEMLDICKSRSEEFKLSNIVYIKTGKDKIPIDSDLLDDVLLANVYHEFPNRKNTNLELNRILKKGGKLFVIDWRYQKMDFGPPLEHRITEEKLIAELKLSEFTLVNKYDLYKFNYVLEFKKL